VSGGWNTPVAAREQVELGETYVQGKDQATAQLLLRAARELELDTLVVRTARAGFVVPSEVWDKAQELNRADSGLDF
jgi:hypothetical protein